jgi:hypothetical protein
LEKIWKKAVVIINVLQRYFARGAEENHVEREDSRSPGRDVNPGPAEYEAGVVSTLPREEVYPKVSVNLTSIKGKF